MELANMPDMKTTTWNIDPSHSSINFSVRHLVIAKVRGRFAKFSGTVSLEDQTVEVQIDAASVDTAMNDRDNHLRSPDFLNAAQFPYLTFKSKHAEKTSNGYRVTGDLTIRDVTREVVLDAEALGEMKDHFGNERVAFAAKAQINRADFGLTWNKALETGGVVVGEKIDIELEVQAIKAKAAVAA
jgi:polyisoprenoid-binding protein YceI